MRYVQCTFFPSPSTGEDVIYNLYSLYHKVAVVGKEVSPIEWMLALPLYHFLKKQSEPFGELNLTTVTVWEKEQDLGLKSAQQKTKKLEK